MHKKLVITSLMLVVFLSACGVTLASDVTPPPSYKSPVPAKPQAQTTPAPVSLPLLPPDPVQGAALYAEKCVACHGATGRGDGAQAMQMGFTAPAIGSLELARQARPAAWYEVVTTGRMERNMPPFRSLNDRQRWDVLAYVFTLSTPAESTLKGKALYEQQCAACHGANGRGSASVARSPDWGDPTRLATRSAADLAGAISKGVAPGMPAYAGKLSEDQLWALVDYIRTFSFAGSAGSDASLQTTPAPTPGATAAQADTFKVNIAGKVSQTNGAALPGGLKVNIRAYDNMAPTWESTADVQADGSYRFADVEVKTGRTFMAMIEYKGVPFVSTPLHAADLQAGQEATLPIVLSEVSSDLSGVSAQRMHVFFDFSQDGKLQVAELFVLVNSGDKAVAPAAPDQPLLRFSLPAGAEELAFQDGELGDGRYVQTADGFGDLSPILPKDQLQVLFAYLLPYPGQQSVSLALPMAVDSASIMVPAGGVKVQSSQLTAMGVRTVENMDIQIFSANSLPASARLDLTLSGLPSANPVPAGTVTGAPASSNELIIAIAVLGVALIAAGLWLYRQRRGDARAEEQEDREEESEEVELETRESLLDAIVALDDLYQAGQLPESAYHERRAELKARLANLKKDQA